MPLGPPSSPGSTLETGGHFYSPVGVGSHAMDVTEGDARVVVDYDGSQYTFEVVDGDELAYRETSGEDAEAPDEVIERLETRGYVVTS